MKLAALLVLAAATASAAPAQVVRVELDRDQLASSWSALVPHEPEPGGVLVPASADGVWFKLGLQPEDIVRYLDGAPVTTLDTLRDGLHVLEIDRRGHPVLLRVLIHGPSTIKSDLSESSFQDIVDRLADPEPRTTPVRDKAGPSGVRIVDFLLGFQMDFEIGDIVRTIGGAPIFTNAAFTNALRGLPVGVTEIVLDRFGRRITIEITRAAPLDLMTIERISATRFDLARATYEALREDVSLLEKKVAAAPIVQRGVVTGLRLYEMKPDSLCAALGLQNEDVLLEIEGRSIGSLDSLFAARSFLSNAGQITVKLERKGKRIAITYVVR